MSVINDVVYAARLLMKSPPGPPPRKGLEWKEETHRWIRPEEESQVESSTGVFQSLSEHEVSDEDLSRVISSMLDENKSIREDLKGPYSDNALREYAKVRWGTQNVKVVDGDVFDSIDSPLMARGISNKEHLESNLNEEFFGLGNKANGQFYGYDTAALGAAFSYYSNKDGIGWVHTAKLHPDAKIASGKEAEAVWQRIKDIDTASLPAGRMRITPEQYQVLDYGEFEVDPGRVMAMQGYDGAFISPYADSGGILVIFNKRSLVVDERSLLGGEIEQRVNQLIDEGKHILSDEERDNVQQQIKDVKGSKDMSFSDKWDEEKRLNSILQSESNPIKPATIQVMKEVYYGS